MMADSESDHAASGGRTGKAGLARRDVLMSDDAESSDPANDRSFISGRAFGHCASRQRTRPRRRDKLSRSPCTSDDDRCERRSHREQETDASGSAEGNAATHDIASSVRHTYRVHEASTRSPSLPLMGNDSEGVSCGYMKEADSDADVPERDTSSSPEYWTNPEVIDRTGKLIRQVEIVSERALGNSAHAHCAGVSGRAKAVRNDSSVGLRPKESILLDLETQDDQTGEGSPRTTAGTRNLRIHSGPRSWMQPRNTEKGEISDYDDDEGREDEDVEEEGSRWSLCRCSFWNDQRWFVSLSLLYLY